MTDDNRIDALADHVAALQQQINSMSVSPGMSRDERDRLKELEDKAAMAELADKGLMAEVSALRKAIADLPSRKDLQTAVDQRAVRVAELTGEALGTFAGDARAYAEEAARDASLIARKAATKAVAASEANITAAVAFIRRSLHNFAS